MLHISFSFFFLLNILSLLQFVSPVYGSSRRSPPLKRVAHPEHVSVQIIPRITVDGSATSPLRKREPLSNARRTVLHSDTIRITVKAFSDTFHLHLQPNDELIHPAASIKYMKTTPTGSVVDRIERLSRESFMVFGGDVISNEHTSTRLDEDYAGGLHRAHGSHPPPGYRGWARIMVVDGGDPSQKRPPVFEGAFSVDGVIHHVLTSDNYMRTRLPGDPEPSNIQSDMVIFRDSDIMSHAESENIRSYSTSKDSPRMPSRPQTCAHDRLDYNVDNSNPVIRYGAELDRAARNAWLDPFGLSSFGNWALNSTLSKRQGDIGGGDSSSTNFASTIGQTDGCPKTQQIIYMGVVSDCTYTQTNGGNANATQNILRNFNTVSLLYKSTFNISLGITELQISDQTCPSSDTANPWNIACGSVALNERLSLFSAWRGQKFDALSDASSDPTGLWHLMSGCPSGTEVGVAWLGTVCVKRASGNAPSVVSGTGVSTGGRTEWQVIAHEIGHNLGAIHDCTDGCSLSDKCCPLNAGVCDSQNQFLMNPTSSASEQVFSPCTVGNICSLMQSTNLDTSCIQSPNANQRTFSLQMCGNGIVEAGEECDPGAGSNSNCCDPTTCKFINGAVCDPSSSSCCTSTCQFAPATQVCRPAKDLKCDTAETCTGTSAECPADQTAPNGQSCGTDGLACAMGTCTSITQQCQIVGASLNLTKACPSNSEATCQVSCQDPRNPSQCIVLNSQLVDGSPCGYGGTCISGNCRAGTFLQTAIAWYTQNLQISIPVSVVVAIVVVLILWSIFAALRRSCTRKKDRSGIISTQIPPNAPAQRLPSWTPGMRTAEQPVEAGPFAFPPQRMNRNGSGSSGHSVRPNPSRQLSDTSGRQREANPNQRQQYPLQPSYGRDTTWQGNSEDSRPSTRNRSNWVDEREYNGSRR
ncbi:hypothetical protein CPB86DRAFT_754147 [Serendipita vermifera]|nr:hypothetical protein CPB86DRAFT_754147 [Serendipita vermifera]